MGYIYINSIMKNPSLCDGIGTELSYFYKGVICIAKAVRTKVLGILPKEQKKTLKSLRESFAKSVFNKELTISGGEPLMQTDALLELLEELKDFNLCLYTGHELNEVPEKVLSYLKYVKVGRFEQELKTTTQPFVGSSNQQFIEVSHHE